jgi:hypothetical protein
VPDLEDDALVGVKANVLHLDLDGRWRGLR